MLRVTADVFSGRPDPAWVITDEVEARDVLRALTRERDLITDRAPSQAGLGLRGLRVEPLSDDLAQDFDLASTVYLAVGPYGGGGRAPELAERLISSARGAESSAADTPDVLPLDVPLEEFLSGELDRVSGVDFRSQLSTADGPAAAGAPEAEAAPAATCWIESGAFNPGFWNDDATVRSRNNCYNYATNWRTDTFAQPGRGCGQMYRAITCDEVTRGALCDGMHHRYDCFPDSERPRYLVALVVAPGPGFVDFHWYRRQREGFWGHKPGGTAARNVDNRGVVITDPQAADRGPYSLFCGYFYGCHTQQLRIR